MTSILTRRNAMWLATGGAAALSGCVATTDTMATNLAATYTPDYFNRAPARFPQFSQAPSDPAYGYDFKALNQLLSKYVVDFGESDRVALQRPEPSTGTRFPTGHQSPYRTEGNRIPFSLFEKPDLEKVSSVRKLIENLPAEYPLREARWLDQMAYWFNLHNITMIERIALNYPVTKPGAMRVGSVLFDDAKVLNVEGTPLSLRDIRNEIVYRYWRHPAAMYGFFRGDVGGPSIQNYAFDGDRLSQQLAVSAREFVNALRGVRDFGGYIGVSQLYSESALFFDDFEPGLRAHLITFADDDVGEILQKPKPLRIVQYDKTVADLAGGRRNRNTVPTSASTAFTETIAVDSFVGLKGITTDFGALGLSAGVVRQLKEQNQKRRRLRARERFKRREGRVTIEDLPSGPTE